MHISVAVHGRTPDRSAYPIREKLLRWGPACLSSEELLGLILGTGGPPTGGRDPERLILDRFTGIAGLHARSPREIAEVPGVGLARACRVAAAVALATRLKRDLAAADAMDTPQLVFERYQHLALEGAESIVVLALNAHHRVIREIVVGRGSGTACVVRPREIFAPAIQEKAVGIVLLHSHPSGDPTPSRQDLAFTERVVRAGELLGIRVVDHIVVGATGYTSLRQEGQMAA